MPKTRSQMTLEEAQNYLNAFNATVNSLTTALTKFRILAADASTDAKRAEYNAAVLETTRQRELVFNKRRAFDADTAIVNPPDGPTVERTRQISADVAQIQAKEANFAAIAAGVTSALTEFNKIHV